MEILKTQLQIVLGLVICVLIYQHMTKHPQAAEPQISMEMIQQQAASGKIPLEAQNAANSMVATGDMAEFQTQLNAQGLLDINN